MKASHKEAVAHAASERASTGARHPRLGSRAEHYAAGKALRETCPREAHAAWKAPADRRDAVELVLAAEKGRVEDLLPLRHGRMVKSAFTFYRGAALTMAADLATTPTTGIRVQCCGDAHLCNFGGFATPERRIIFSINDLDETLPAPWEWDLKRLAASFVVACRDNGLSEAVAKDAAMTCVRSYRESMAEFSQLKTLELWYRSLSAEELLGGLPLKLRKRILKRIEKEQAKSRGEEMFPKLAEKRGNIHVIKDQLPTIFHAEGHSPGEVQQGVRDALVAYRETLPTAYRALLDRYELQDAADQGGRRRQRRDRCAGCCSSRPETTTPSSSRSRKRAPRCWSRTPARASSRTTASASWTATGACSPPATCSWAGAGGRSATSSSAS